MGVIDYFKPVSSWSVDEVRAFLERKGQGDYNLVDVRQPGEYKDGHLPGARLMPLGELPDRVDELERDKPTIVYCAAGVRSRAGASILERAGFRRVWSMEGGINAWRGAVARGLPESAMAWFAPGASTEKLIALAWVLEEGAREFYSRIAGSMSDRHASALFSELVDAEVRHEAMLSVLYREMIPTAGEADFHGVLGESAGQRVMEGGMEVADALAWAENKSPAEIAEFALSMEAVSYDRYLAMASMADDAAPREIFTRLAAEEKKHLSRLTEIFENNL